MALDGMSVPGLPEQVTGFVEPNGAGKSIMMRVILGLDAADAGGALAGGQPYRILRHPLSHAGGAAGCGRAAAQGRRQYRSDVIDLPATPLGASGQLGGGV